MLDTETKGKIDSARDILVGKVPDPKSQVEQITIALIYKFMDDMDRQSEEIGGKASFFTGEFKKYRWAQLLDKRFSGHERLLLYAEGIEKMNENKHIPQLFRDIFKGVFLPYRDPETLNLFLKEINGFTYDHSERLGDAFEYLLSVLGTQGDAGQFRTPRHIIDFIVAVVDPKKNETILDPACGTAGFLISAYKHILKSNKVLTPDERARLMTNFRGYDIAPDMVRLSRVNMYLHGFPNPVIHEYDTLTSEERWNERCDVILANPPFMSPKGGIRPHNRFSIKAKRSEVLFVDYIAEHLTPGGRAGIIVPEGIIFQSQNAYKSLRKMLVENYLWVVVSLPAGVFNPYAGVKTSILFLDRNLAKRTNEILFVKVENDGFDLGAQRRPIEGSQLPEAFKVLDSHKKGRKTQEGKIALTVPRKRLLESSDLNFSGDRYRTVAVRGNGKWPMVKVGKVCQVIAGQSPDGCTYNDRHEGVPFHQGKTEFSDTFLGKAKLWTTAPSRIAETDDIVMSVRAPVGPVNIVRERICIGRGLAAIRPKLAGLNGVFLFHVLRGLESQIVGSHGAAFASINRSEIESIDIPLPSLEEQERIVAELEGYRKVIEGARQILASYKPTIRIDPKWPMVRMCDAAKVNRETIDPRIKYSHSEFCYIDISAVENGTGRLIECARIKGKEAPGRARRVVVRDDVLLSTVRPNLKAFACLDEIPPDAIASTGFAVLTPEIGQTSGRFLWNLLFDAFVLNQMLGRMGKGAYPSINQNDVESLIVPLPPLDVQRRIVAELEAERKLVETNRELIARMEEKIKTKLAEVWSEEK